MPAPEIPTEAVELLSDVNGNPYNASTNPDGLAKGGHRQNWAPAMNALATVANWIASTVSYLSDLAAQVATDAASAAAGSGTEATVSAIRSGINAFYLSIRNVYAANVPVALVDAATITWDMAGSINAKVTLGAAGRTLANPTNQVAGKSGIIIFTQDATGGRSVTTWGNNFVWIGDQPVWPSTPGAKVVVSYLVEAVGTVLLSYGGASA